MEDQASNPSTVQLIQNKPIELALTKSEELKRQKKIEELKSSYFRYLIHELSKLLCANYRPFCGVFHPSRQSLLEVYQKDQILAVADLLIGRARRRTLLFYFVAPPLALIFIPGWMVLEELYEKYFLRRFYVPYKKLVKMGLNPLQMFSDFLDECDNNKT